MTDAGEPPGKNEFEITLFGPGYGECVVLHVGNGVSDACEVWSLSPDDSVFQAFLKAIGALLPGTNQPRIRAPSLSPNEVAVALWVQVGAKNADEPNVWTRMLVGEPVAVLTPWRRGGRELPTPADVRRIRSYTPNGYVTARHYPTGRTRPGMVERTLRELGVTLRRVPTSSGAIRLRRRLGADTDWKVETFGTACRLGEFAA